MKRKGQNRRPAGNAIRIYTYYDSRIRRMIIGSMMKHLPMNGLLRAK